MRSVALLFLVIHLVVVNSKVICDHVIGHVGDQTTLTCRVRPPSKDLCVLKYKFMDNHYETICEEDFGDQCKQFNSFTCPFTANSVMINPWDQFNFYFLNRGLNYNTGIDATIPDFATITCEHVTGIVGEKFNLSCRVSYQSDRCCILAYKFMKTKRDDDPTICKEEFSYNPCRQLTSFSCPYSENSAMTTNVKFFLNTTCGPITTQFTVNVTDGDDSGKKAITASEVIGISVGCLLPLIVFIAIMGLLVWRKSRQVKSRKLTGDVKKSPQSTSLYSLEGDRPNF